MSSFDKFKIGIGVVTFNNSQQELKRYARSLAIAVKRFQDFYKTNFAPTLFVIDNGNQTKLADFYKKSEILNSKGNIGYTAACNLLIKRTFENSELTHFLSSNPDGAFHPDFFIEMFQFVQKYPNDLIEAIQFPEEHLKKYDPKNFETKWASGCCCLFSKDIINEVGLLDENFFLYVEDVDYSWRVRLAGRKVRTCVKAKYAHFVLNRQPSKTTTKFIYDSGRYMAIKWGNKKFQRFCEKTLIDEGIYKKASQFKKFKFKKIPVNKKQKKIITFEYYFHFSDVRWE